MGSLIRATNLWGYGDLVRELGADPGPFLSRFHIQPGIEYQEDAFVSFEATVRLLEASAADLDCPDFGLRLARWQGLDILGPIAVIARNAQTLLGGLESIARYLYVHSPALKLAVARTTDADLQFIYKMTEPTPLQMSQGYELSMANAVRMIRLLGGPEARPARSHSCTAGWVRTLPTERRWVALCSSGSRRAGSCCPGIWPPGVSTARTPRPGASPRSTWRPTTFRAPRRCPNAWPSWPVGCCPPASAAPRSSPTN